MLTTISKVMTVFVTVASIAFVGFAFAARNSGPNWQEETAPLRDYDFALSTGENPTWSVKHRTGEQPLQTTKVLPEAIAKAYEDAKRRIDEEIATVQPRIEPQQKLNEAIVKLIEIDLKGLETRRKQMLQQLQDLNQRINEAALETNKLGVDTLKIRNEAERRRDDVIRLARNIQAIRADHYQLEEQKRRLLDLLYQLQGLRDRLKSRAEDLSGQTAETTT